MPTATDPLDPNQVFAAIDRIKLRIEETVKAELEFEKSRKTRAVKLAQEITRREDADAAALASKLAELEANYQTATLARERAYLIRRDHLPRAYHASRAALAKRLEEKKNEKVGKAQGSILSDRKILQDRLAQATSKHHEFMVGLMSDREEIRQCKDSAFKIFRTYAPLIESLFNPKNTTESPSEGDRNQSLEQIKTARVEIEKAATQPIAKAFRYAPLWLLVLLLGGLHLAITRSVGPGLLVTLALPVIVWGIGLLKAWPVAKAIASSLNLAKDTSRNAEKTSADAVALLAEENEKHEKAHHEGLSQTFQKTEHEISSLLKKGQEELQKQLALLPDRMLDLHRKRLARLDAAYQSEVARIRKEAEETAVRRKQARTNASHTTDVALENAISQLIIPWQEDVITQQVELAALEEKLSSAFPAWTDESISHWFPPTELPHAIRIGHIEIEPTKLVGGYPKHDQFSLQKQTLIAPLTLGFTAPSSILIETDGDSSDATAVLNAISIRLLASLPPGRASFIFIDPVGLGKDFAGLMHLADYEESLINHRIWTQSSHIDERLAELNEHIEKVIQMYLRNEFATIEDYNAQAGVIAEKYRFLVIAGFPSAFTETAMKRLRSIAASGSRCGVHLIIQRDNRHPSVDPMLDEELRRSSIRILSKNGAYFLNGDRVIFDAAPPASLAMPLIHRIGKASVDSNRVEVPFSQIMPSPEERWSLDTSEELRVPIGRTGAKKLQMLSLGKGTRQHALIAGKTGSGKSTLFHVIITNLSLWCSPAQVEFYLVDFKKGVEFKCYADQKLPHARVIAIESDRHFALSVLQRVDAELKRRGELFRKSSSQDLTSYNQSGESPLPRTLLLIDEFQEFFTEDDSTAQQASLLLDRIVRQGRAFGIHVILGSQTLGGAYTLARATLGQMAVRIALQCNETDAHLIMDEDNPAPRMLTRPGEGIYNDQSGATSANSPFQIVWLSERERNEILRQISGLAGQGEAASNIPVIFEGNAPADIRENLELQKALHTSITARPNAAQAWLGAPNSIKGPTSATFRRQSGNNLLIVSQSNEQSSSLLASALLSLSSQYPKDGVEFLIMDPRAADETAENPLKDLYTTLPQHIRIGSPTDAPEILADLSQELAARSGGSEKNAREVFLIIHDLHRFKCLKPDDEFRFSYDETTNAPSPSQIFADLLSEGSSAGIHVIVSTDTWNNVSRWIPRKLLSEFEMRVLLQMSASDSANLIDSPEASGLGLHRALFHNEHLGTLETFRPYAPMESDWINATVTALSSK